MSHSLFICRVTFRSYVSREGKCLQLIIIIKLILWWKPSVRKFIVSVRESIAPSFVFYPGGQLRLVPARLMAESKIVPDCMGELSRYPGRLWLGSPSKPIYSSHRLGEKGRHLKSCEISRAVSPGPWSDLNRAVSRAPPDEETIPVYCGHRDRKAQARSGTGRRPTLGHFYWSLCETSFQRLRIC